MSAAQQLEWLSLVEKTGPFLAVGVLDEAFPQGLEKVETRKRQRVRNAYDEWRDAVDGNDSQLEALHREWVNLILRELLDYEPEVLKAEADATKLRYDDPLTGGEIVPDFAVMSGDKARILIKYQSADTDLDAPPAGDSWAASPIERMVTLCRALGVRVGVVTNGEHWAIVSVPAEGGSSSVGTWFGRIWQQEPVTLQAFVSLLGVRRCFGPESETLEALLARSLQHQDEVTDTLGEQVRRAVEVLVQALDRADLDRNRELLRDVSATQLYEAGLTVMMRLVVLLCAEERKLLLLGEPVYDEYYAVSTLRSKLYDDKERFGEDVLERRHDAWSRLLAVFRAVFGGIEHETLRLPALGGSLFDPDRFPFLEGRAGGTSWRDVPAVPLPIDNRTVLMLLTALQVLEQRSGAQVLSYEALDVEQIGHVYEGLLERTVARVPELTLGLTGSQKAINPNVPLRELEDALKDGHEELLTLLLDKTGRSQSGLKNALAKVVDDPLYSRILRACGSEIGLADRIKPFAHLLRIDSWGDPLAYRENSFIVTLGAGRRETGTHYTPRSLTEPIVQHAIEPLAYVGPAEGKPRKEWNLKSPDQLLALKICDLAMGSGAFLVQTCRWLAERLVEAWDAEEKAGRVISIESAVIDQAGDAELLPRDRAERVIIARRLIASRCLYGVDVNPMAVELAKLSLWLITMIRNRPFSFLDHALKCGDSLVGVSQLEQLERFSLRDSDQAEALLETADLWRHIEQAATLRRALEAMPGHTAAQIAEKARLHCEAEVKLAKLKAAADFLIAAEISCPGDVGWNTLRAIAASTMQAAWKNEPAEFQRLARIGLSGRRPFHWPLEFPEVFSSLENSPSGAGLDAVVGNPPFMSGKGGDASVAANLGSNYTLFLERAYEGSFKSADICAFFFRRAFSFLNSGTFGLLATKTIAEGKTRETGLKHIVSTGGIIYRAERTRPWPGKANVFVSTVHVVRAPYAGELILDGKRVNAIDSYLSALDLTGEPFALRGNYSLAFQGTKPRGDFCVPNDQAVVLLQKKENRRVLVPYVRGEDIKRQIAATGTDHIIDFARCEGDPAKLYPELYKRCRQQVFDYRQKQKEVRLRDQWWLFEHRADDLYSAIGGISKVLCAARLSNHLVFTWVDAGCVFSDQVVVFRDHGSGLFATLQSSIHDAWCRRFGKFFKGDLRYNQSDCLETFPLPPNVRNLNSVGERYNEERKDIMLTRCEGLTKVYNRFHSPEETADDVAELRELHRQLDRAVAALYGWSDLAANEGAALHHDFQQTTQGVRWTVPPDVRRDILDRLLTLNHKRHAEEIAASPQNEKTKKTTRNSKRSRSSPAKEILDLL